MTPSRLAPPAAGRAPLLLLLATLLAVGTACPGITPAESADAGKAGKDASKPGRDADEGETLPDAEVATAPDGGVVLPVDGGVVSPVDGGGTPTPDGGGPTPNTFWLTLLHSSDTESAMVPSSTSTWGGVAYFTTLVKNLKAEAAAWKPTPQAGEVVRTGTLVVSAGDNFLAGLTFKTSLDHGVPFYETTAMQEIGYQASALGNHDFDFGPNTLADFLRGFNPAVPFVSANIDVSAEAQLQAQATAGRLAKSVTLEISGEKIGVIGAVTEELPSLSMIKAVTVSPMVAAIQGEVTRLTGAGVNKIVLLSHNQALANDKKLVPLLSGVDIVVSGGGHEIAANAATVLATGDKAACGYPENVNDADGNSVPIVVAGSLYKYIGRLVAKFDSAGKLVEIDATLSTPVRVSNSGTPDAVTADSAVDTYVVTPIKNATATLKTKVVATSAVPLEGRRANIRTQETNEGDLMADALLWQAQQLAGAAGVASPKVALQNGGGIRNDSVIPAGTLSEYDTFVIAPFSNRVAISQNVSRDTLKALLENAVSRVADVDGRFLQVAGLKFTWDAAFPARNMAATPPEPGQRVRSVTLDEGNAVVVSNGVVQAGAAVSVATIDFLANGGDGSPYGGATFTILDATYQEALKNYLVTGLGGAVTAAKYPTGGTGRITALNTCGNGLMEGTEGCDDKNAVANDGCSDKCAVETDWVCQGTPSVCTKCGNGKLDAPEECDGAELDGKTCATVPGGFTGGTLGCKADCTFDTAACAQRRDLAVFTFETSLPATAGPFAAESGTRAATSTILGSHANPQAVYSNPAGNGSAESFSSNYWAIGDYYEVKVPVNGVTDLEVGWDQTRSASGPATFKLQWSTDGASFQDLVASYAVPDASWSSTSKSTASVFAPVALPAGANGAANVWIRFTATAAPTSTVGASRIDNVTVTGVAP